MPNKIGATFIIVRPNKTILMQLRDGNCKRFPHQWCFPGGTPDRNENPLATILREAKEEYELELDEARCTFLLINTSDYIHNVRDYVFLCWTDAKQEPVMHEGADFAWMTLEEIEKITLGFEQDKVVPYLARHLAN